MASERTTCALLNVNNAKYMYRSKWLILYILTVVLLQVEQPSPGIDLHAWCTVRESTVGAWSKVTHGQYLVLYL